MFKDFYLVQCDTCRDQIQMKWYSGTANSRVLTEELYIYKIHANLICCICFTELFLGDISPDVRTYPHDAANTYSLFEQIAMHT